MNRAKGNDWRPWAEGRDSTWYTKELKVPVGAHLGAAQNYIMQ